MAAKLSPKKWAELTNGFGLEEVPREMKEDVACCMCGYQPGKGKLYTDQLDTSYNSESSPTRYSIRYNQSLERVRHNCYCRYHAEQMFGEREE